MGVTSGFFNSLNGDRKYDAVQMSQIFDGVITDGVYMHIGNRLMVRQNPVASMDVIIGSGRSWFDHVWCLNDADLPITIPTSEVLLNRIDAIVEEIDHREQGRVVTFKVIKGTPASSPVRPNIKSSDPNITRYALAYITVPKGAVSITQANITSVVGSSQTPYVTSVLEGFDIDELVSQWQTKFNEWMITETKIFDDYFNNKQQEINAYFLNQQNTFGSWFDEIKGQLSEDAAGNLQEQINALKYIYYKDETIYLPLTMASYDRNNERIILTGETAIV